MRSLPSPYRILLVDKQKILRQGIRLLLKRSDEFEVVGDTDGTRAVALAVTLRPAIVLIDLRLPLFEDGLKILAELVESVPDVRAIVLTAAGEDGNTVYHAVRNGAVGCVLKNTGDIAEVEEAIRQVAQGQLYLSSTALQSLVESVANRADGRGNQNHTVTLDELTPREEEVLELVALGHTNREIADRLVISDSTVRSHLHNILDKLQLTNRVQAAAFALRQHQSGPVQSFSETR
jgi:two-component system, NarL family, nitrate/nitrite response regulator NarL